MEAVPEEKRSVVSRSFSLDGVVYTLRMTVLRHFFARERLSNVNRSCELFFTVIDCSGWVLLSEEGLF
jgi:hypothetical protein